MSINEMNIRSARDPEGALGLFALLGYDTSRPKHADLSSFRLEGEGKWVRSAGSKSKGYGILVGEIEKPPRSFKAFGRALMEELHDYPLAILGVRNSGGWAEWILVRPRLIRGKAGAVAVTKLRVDPSAPTRHDVDVVGSIAWDTSRTDDANHAEIDRALDVERVTTHFFDGLNAQFNKVVEALEGIAGKNSVVREGLELADPEHGADRVGLRIITQTLFCYFLQKKGLLAGDRRWLSRAYDECIRKKGEFYPDVMERLFYEGLNVPAEQRDEGGELREIPFLNGGLFERHYGEVSLPLANDLFSTEEGLLGFLDGWNFTISEDTADETDVAVDPEMLGKVFESLITEGERKVEGTIYTPRPVVQFMCREALVPFLEDVARLDETTARLLVTSEQPFEVLETRSGRDEATLAARAVTHVLEDLRVIDPAVGSGAFLLGMLAEIVALRSSAYELLEGHEPDDERLVEWKLHAIEECLFGVDIQPRAIELCRLRLWLALLVDTPAGQEPHPLPNLEYRTICADSLPDFLNGIEVQNTRGGLVTTLGLQEVDLTEIVRLRELYFEASRPTEKAKLRKELESREDQIVEDIFRDALTQAQEQKKSGTKKISAGGEEAEIALEALHQRFGSRDRVYPMFLPGFLAPDVVQRGGWDIVIMNPPYLSRKEARQSLPSLRLADLGRHYGRTYDLMIHFGFRARQLTRPGG